jgi:hypothetical protein
LARSDMAYSFNFAGQCVGKVLKVIRPGTAKCAADTHTIAQRFTA